MSSMYAQDLPRSLFPNQEIYDIEAQLQRDANLGTDISTATHTNTWTLQDVIDMALLNNLELAQSKKDYESAKATYTGSIQDFYVPNLSVSASADFRDLFTTSTNSAVQAAMDEGYTMSLTLPSITLSKTLFNGFATMYSFRIAKQNYLNAQNTYNNQMREVVYQATVRYYDQFLKLEEVKVSLERIKQVKSQLQQAEINFRNGRVSDFDVATAKSQYYSAEPTYFSAEKNRLYAREDFYRYIGYVPESDIHINLKGNLLQVTNVVFSEFDENASIAFIFSNDTQLATLRTAYENSKSQKGIQNSARLPKVNASFFYTPSWGSDVSLGNFSESDYNGAFGVQASISVPILEWIPGTSTASAVKSAQANINKAQFALLDAEEQKLIQIKNNLLTIRELEQSVNAFRISEEQARRAAEIAQAQYGFGRISIIDLNIAQVDYIDAKKSLLTSVYNSLSAKLQLQQAMNTFPAFLEEVKKIENIENNIAE